MRHLMLNHALACLNVRKKNFFKPFDLAFFKDSINIAWINVLFPRIAISDALQRFSIYISRSFNSLSQNFENDRLKESFQGCLLFCRTQFFAACTFLFIKNIIDIATEKKVMTENYIFALRFRSFSKSSLWVQLQILFPATLHYWYFTGIFSGSEVVWHSWRILFL